MKLTEKQAAEATIDDHLRNMINLMKRGAHVILTGIPDDPTFLSTHFASSYAKAMAVKIEAALTAALAVEAGTVGVKSEDWETPEARAKVMKRARQLWNADQYSCSWSEENREHYIIRASMEIALTTSPASSGVEGEAMARIVDCVTEMDSRWFFGRYGFVLRDAFPLPLVPCRGQLGFFNLEPATVRSRRRCNPIARPCRPAAGGGR